jgi:hypothetical protein
VFGQIKERDPDVLMMMKTFRGQGSLLELLQQFVIGQLLFA